MNGDLAGGTAFQPGPRLGKAAAAGILLGALGMLFYPLLAEQVVPAWLGFDGFFSHGFAVLAMVVMLVWEDRRAIFGSREPGSRLWAGASLAAALCWFLGWAADLMALQLAAMVGVLLTACCAVLGRRSIFSFGLPFALFFVAVPMWSPVQPPLQSLSAMVVERLIRLSGIPVLIEGHLVHIPAGLFEVERGCSGLGFLLVSIALGGYLALTRRAGVTSSLVLLSGAVALALLTNWIRIYLIIVIAHVGGMDQQIVRNHDWLGWAVFATIVLPALLLAARWLDKRSRSGDRSHNMVRENSHNMMRESSKVWEGSMLWEGSPEPDQGSRSGDRSHDMGWEGSPEPDQASRSGDRSHDMGWEGSPEPDQGSRSEDRSHDTRGSVSAGFLLLVLAFSATPPAAALWLDRGLAVRTAELPGLPDIGDGYRQVDGRFDWRPDFPGADRTELTAYERAGTPTEPIAAFRAGYLQQADGREVVNLLNDLGGPGWRPAGGQQVFAIGSGRPVTEQRFAAADGRTLCVWHWYRIGSVHAGTPFDAKVAQVLQRMLGRKDAGLTALASMARSGACHAQRDRIADLAQRLL